MLIRRMDASTLALIAFDKSGAMAVPGHAATQKASIQAEIAEPSLHAELRDLERQIELLQEELTHQRAVAEREREEAFASGVSQGRQSVTDSEAERIALLQHGLSKATTEWAATLDTKTDIAVVIARETIRKILGDASARVGMVEDVVRHAVGGLFSGEVLEVRLSTADFPVADGLAALAGAFPQVSFVREAGLAAGSCWLDLKLGTVDASLTVQAAAADAELGRFEADPGGGA